MYLRECFRVVIENSKVFVPRAKEILLFICANGYKLLKQNHIFSDCYKDILISWQK